MHSRGSNAHAHTSIPVYDELAFNLDAGSPADPDDSSNFAVIERQLEMQRQKKNEESVWEGFSPTCKNIIHTLILLSVAIIGCAVGAYLTHQHYTTMLDTQNHMVTASPQSRYPHIAWLIPVFKPHLLYLVRFLKSAIRFCPSCCELPILLVVGVDEELLFTKEVVKLPELRNLTISITTLPEVTWYWQQDPTLGTRVPRSKSMLQSFKKLFGCLATNRTYCWVTDAESFFVRPTSVEEIVLDYVDRPFILGNSWVRDQREYETTKVVGDLLDIRRRIPWFLELYQWVFELQHLRHLAEVIHQKHPTFDHFEQAVTPNGPTFFIECYYFAYIWHEQLMHKRFPEWDIYDAHDMLPWEFWATYKKPFRDAGEMEDIRGCWNREAEKYVSEAWERNRFHIIKIHKEFAMGDRMIRNLTSLRICLSEQPSELYEAAMAGAYILPEPKPASSVTVTIEPTSSTEGK